MGKDSCEKEKLLVGLRRGKKRRGENIGKEGFLIKVKGPLVESREKRERLSAIYLLSPRGPREKGARKEWILKNQVGLSVREFILLLSLQSLCRGFFAGGRRRKEANE